MPALPLVYLETSFVSYLTARPSRDASILAKQLSSSVWWSTCSSKYQLRSSRLVVREASEGAPTSVQERLSVLAGVNIVADQPASWASRQPVCEGESLTQES